MSALVLMMLAQMGQPMQRWMPNQDDGALPLFGFASGSGAGMPPPCDSPNWAGYSEEMDNANHSKIAFGGPVAPVVTADFAAGPFGGTNADRVQFAAVTGAQYSIMDPVNSIIPKPNPWKSAFWIRGNGTSGVITQSTYNGSVAECFQCAFTPTWSQCVPPATQTNVISMYIGNNSLDCPAFGAQAAIDVVIWGWQVNIGTLTSYARTVDNNPKWTIPASTDGIVLGGSRSGSATCSKKGFAYTGIENGDLSEVPTNMMRVERNSNGQLGVHVEMSGTNEELRSEELNLTGGAPYTADGALVVTANQAVGPKGALTAERIESAATSGATFSTIYQPFTSAAAAGLACSVFVKGNGSSGTTDLCYYDGAAWTCTACAFVSATWSRCYAGAATGTATSRFCKLGNNSGQNGGIARSAADFFAWGFQGEQSTTGIPTSYTPTTSVPVARNIDSNPHFIRTITPPSGVCVAATVEVPSLNYYASGAGLYAPMLSNSTATASPPYVWPFTASLGASLAIDGALSASLDSYIPATDNPTLIGRYVVGHTGSAWSYCANGTCRTGPASTWLAGTYQYIKLSVNASLATNAIWSDVEVDPTFTRCRR